MSKYIDDMKPPLKEIKSADEKKILSLKEISRADHVVFDFRNNNYIHAIIEEIVPGKNEAYIIFYDDGLLEKNFKPYENFVIADKPIESSKEGVKELNIHVDLNKFDIYKLIYNQEMEPNLESDETIAKAKDMLGKEKYNVFVNNDEHFAGYCKTGKAGRLFILDPQDINLRNILGGTIYDRIQATLRSTGMNVLLVQTAKHLSSNYPRDVFANNLPRLIQVGGSLLGLGIESLLIGKDIYKKYQEKSQGKLDEIKFKKYVAKRVSRGAFGIGFVYGGSALGQQVLPIPVVGAVVGGLVGGVVGAVVGQTNGILIGELIEKIDNRIKLKKRKELQKQFRIVNNLVWKYDAEAIRNFLKDDPPKDDNTSYEQIKDDVIDYNNQPCRLNHEKFYCVIDGQELELDNQDFDVFMLLNDLALIDNKGPHELHDIYFKDLSC